MNHTFTPCRKPLRDSMSSGTALADVGARIASIRQLGAVVNAMRGIAARAGPACPGAVLRGAGICRRL